MKVEFIVCWEDTTWSTVIEIVRPTSTPDRHAMEMANMPQYRKAIYIGVYNEDVDQS